MDKKKTDPRVIRTRQMLKNAFVELLQEMEIEKITVNRLAERATINRVTFYLHYQDIPDMIGKMADEMIEDISTVMQHLNMDGSQDIDWGIMVRFLEHIAENGTFYKVLLTSRSIPIFRDRLKMLIMETIVSRIEGKGNESILIQAGIEKDVIIWYDSSAIMGTIVAWLQNDMPYSPASLAKQFYMLHTRKMNADF